MDPAGGGGKVSSTQVPKFCSSCGTRFLPDAAFCHNCGTAVGGRASASAGLSPALKWGVPAAAIVALLFLTLFRPDTREPAAQSANAMPLGAAPPDISSMSPTERADRLFNRVMQYWSEGKTDSASFFAPMALAAFEGISPLTAHVRYDLGLVALVAGDVAKAAAQSDTILAGRPNHLLGLALAIRVADARGDPAAARALRQRLVRSESAERSAGLPEYTDHDPDLKAAVEAAKIR
jgi:hypothetical protein